MFSIETELLQLKKDYQYNPKGDNQKFIRSLLLLIGKLHDFQKPIPYKVSKFIHYASKFHDSYESFKQVFHQCLGEEKEVTDYLLHHYFTTSKSESNTDFKSLRVYVAHIRTLRKAFKKYKSFFKNQKDALVEKNSLYFEYTTIPEETVESFMVALENGKFLTIPEYFRRFPHTQYLLLCEMKTNNELYDFMQILTSSGLNDIQSRDSKLLIKFKGLIPTLLKSQMDKDLLIQVAYSIGIESNNYRILNNLLVQFTLKQFNNLRLANPKDEWLIQIVKDGFKPLSSIDETKITQKIPTSVDYYEQAYATKDWYVPNLYEAMKTLVGKKLGIEEFMNEFFVLCMKTTLHSSDKQQIIIQISNTLDLIHANGALIVKIYDKSYELRNSGDSFEDINKFINKLKNK